ncbi:MAG: class F sortase [Chloroflexi bacterium]|nr:class F sortase [Chloroflexota bacterium]
MGRFSSGSSEILSRLRRGLILGLGAALLAAGVTLLSIGLIGYFDDDTSSAPEASSVADALTSIDDVENLPVAIPYYNPQAREPEPEPTPVTVPLRLVIDRLGVDAPVGVYELDENGVPEVPVADDAGEVVAWYDFSSKPGAGSNAVFAGHVTWNRAPAVFSDLDDLQAGDVVRLVSDDGTEYTYEVFANFDVDPYDTESLKVMAPTETDTVTLITCGGTWIPDPSEQFGGDYTTRTIVQAKLMQSSVTAISDS